MTKNNNFKTRGVTLKTPADVRRITQRVISDIFREQSQIEHAGKINQLLMTWLKGWELEKLSDVEKRLAVLEEDVAKNKEARRDRPGRY
ncbi:hypothetical protein P0O24_11995 [Methanotrichaceae archaeon M04Ac]|uniref:Uncharacterized protein n=1 Tax=Candidatus Methanocrinis alkalitolerans TaxID=3033395 RepID=A0ABT5XHW0_9EURY|nr:hypothetical protein [Candidatus Methanocrinis alkalitolerans]MDF0594301.1 hypothetical protein [Candidatus Methanocrinis alkalitolerans]